MNERERLSKLEGKVTSLSSELQQARTQNATDRDPLEVVKALLALEKTAFQQRISAYVKKREKLVAYKGVIDVEFRQYRTEMDTKLRRLQAFLDDETARADECFFPRYFLKLCCVIDLMIVRRLRAYCIN